MATAATYAPNRGALSQEVMIWFRLCLLLMNSVALNLFFSSLRKKGEEVGNKLASQKVTIRQTRFANPKSSGIFLCPS